MVYQSYWATLSAWFFSVLSRGDDTCLQNLTQFCYCSFWCWRWKQHVANTAHCHTVLWSHAVLCSEV